MVREARFSWDDDDPFRPLDRPDRFEDLDDVDLDPLIPPRRPHRSTASPPADPQQRTESRQRSKTRSIVSDDRRHLAGADWLNDLAGHNAGDD